MARTKIKFYFYLEFFFCYNFFFTKEAVVLRHEYYGLIQHLNHFLSPSVSSQLGYDNDFVLVSRAN